MNLRASSLVHIVLFVFVGLNGFLEFLGIPTAATKFLVLGLILCILFIHGLETRSKLHNQIFLIFVIIYILFNIHIFRSSSLILGVSLFQILSPLILYYLLESLTSYSPRIISSRILIFFLALQITFALIKFIFVGQNEGQGIGTVSIQAGAVSAYVVVSFCLTAIVLNVNKQTAFLILGFALLFAFINEKRIGVLLIGFFAFIIFSDSRVYKFKIFRYFLAIPLAIAFGYVGSVALPSLLEGRSSVLQIFSRITEYLLLVNQNGEAIGRLAGLTQTVLSLEGYEQFIFGKGPSEFLSSSVAGLTNNTNIGFNAVGSTILIGRFGFFGLAVVLGLMLLLLKRQRGRASRLLVFYMIFDIMIYSSGFFLSYLGVYLLLLFRSIEINQSIDLQKQRMSEI